MTITGAELGSAPLGSPAWTETPLLPVGAPARTVYRNPVTKQHEIDPATLQLKQTTPARARVWNVIQTYVNSDSRIEGGMNAPRKIATDGFDRKFANYVRTALYREENVDRILEVRGVFVRVTGLGRVQFHVKFYDLTRAAEDEVYANAV